MKYFSLFFIALCILSGIAYYKTPIDRQFDFITESADFTTQRIYKKQDIPSPPNVKSAHSSTIAPIDSKHLISAYFAGSREGAKDVAIYANIFHNNQWGKAFEILNPKQLMRDTKEYISKIGNPVLYHLDNTLHLFVVGVSIGGWATSKIYHYTSVANPQNIHFHFQKALYLSPFANLSNLVRTPPIGITFNDFQDKGFILPVYHELANKYSLMITFDTTGKKIQISKPNNAFGLLQPSITALDSTHCLIAFRAHKKAKSILYTQKCDNTLKYQPLQTTNITNEDNSLNLFALNNIVYLLHNTRNGNLPRGMLVISRLDYNNQFTKLLDIDDTNTPNGEVSYPYIFISNGILHITYTVDRKFIRHFMLSANYLEEQS